MSIRYSILALLQEQPRYGYQLRAAFEERTGAVWPLNIGQVYTTLNRLERDALVRKEGDDGRGHVLFSITDAGTVEIRRWFSTAVDRGAPPRNELAIKLSLAVSTAGTDAHALIQAQREISLRELQEYTQDRKDLAANQRVTDTARLLVLDSLIFHAEAEARWLDLCEARLVQQSNGASNGVIGIVRGNGTTTA
ncbi:PadR family transcriptional regulator [Arthrobacter bambusae]|uniref:DNA-binding PadR family transcriptional regulator n=1 Tax=Arthrobacter bambusae TaxID=1338426 RepID=A0AAW8DKE9_9MICC|nr:PadR family transcriptional regulator [Arthrobacter bambusae]MDP9906280.1 DNA-binding PadR family transcriptional regulator [Arthrobacter bambusae]MDQ0130487.1 DNA-binding PadR family transcriptional regulator [Arthrobacter bambusae]MDQ0182162.1 DNA-binding PadR family transcriptional regulator [Arthrobacter bambusae]